MPSFNFAPESTGFKLETAYALVVAAELAYADEPQIRQTVEQWGCRSCRYLDRRGCRGFVMSNEAVVVVAFSGVPPEQRERWIADLDLAMTAGPLGGRVNAAVDQSLSGVWEDLEAAIQQLQDGQPKSLWFTGHGLGAALATLAVARLVDEDRPVYGLYTFGSPRVGDRKFTRNFNFEFRVRAFRFVNHYDTVTRLPPRSSGYSHVGTFRYLTDRGELVDDLAWWYQFQARIGGQLEDFVNWGRPGLQDHDVAQYRARLEQLAGPDE